MLFISSLLSVSYALIHEYINSINSVRDEYIYTYSRKGRKHVYFIENRHLNNYSTINAASLTFGQYPKDKRSMYFGRIFETRKDFPADVKGCRDLIVTQVVQGQPQ